MIGMGLAVAWWWSVRQENVKPAAEVVAEGGRARVVDGIWALILPGIIIFGLKFGIFTPTEAAVVCACTR
jgi:TRAP-type C4-dicarboxylate transport system permease large subunit